MEHSFVHARSTGEALSAIDPDYIDILTLMSEPGTPLDQWVRRGEFAIPGPPQLLRELREMIFECEVSHALLRSSHPSNHPAVRGALPEDKDRLLRLLDDVHAAPEQARLKSDYLRGLLPED